MFQLLFSDLVMVDGLSQAADKICLDLCE
jgi:hypothetical protein